MVQRLLSCDRLVDSFDRLNRSIAFWVAILIIRYRNIMIQNNSLTPIIATLQLPNVIFISLLK